jgi:hypothetical protein
MAPPELLASAFVALGVMVGWGAMADARPRLGAAALAGLLMGAALSVKQPAVFEAAALGLAVLVAAPWRARVPGLVAYVLSGALVPLGFAAYYAASGHLDALVNDAVLGAAGRMKGDDLTWGDAIARAPGMLKPVLPLVLGAALVWAERRRLSAAASWPATRMVAIWLAGAAVGILAVKAMYDHYYLTLLAPLCLLAGVWLSQLSLAPRWRLATQGVLAAATLAFFAWQFAPLIAPAAGQTAAERQMADALRGLGERPGDRIFVVSRDLPVYVLAGAEPPGPVFHPQQLLCPYPRLAGADPVAAAFGTRPTFVVLPAPETHMVCEMAARRQEVAAALARDYCPLARSARFTVGGAPDDLTLYGRRDRFAAACRSDLASPMAGTPTPG